MRKDVVILIHGFSAKDKGRNTTDRLKPYFALLGFKVEELDYRWRTDIERQTETPKLVRQLQDMVEHYTLQGFRVAILGHSSGAEVAHLATLSEDKAEHGHLHIYLNASLDAKTAPGGGVKHTQVYYSPSDTKPTKANYPWGTMSSQGYIGQDKSVHNTNLESLLYALAGKTKDINHFNIFDKDDLALFGLYLANMAKTVLGRPYFNE